MRKKKTTLLILASLLTCCSLGSFTSCHNNNDQDTTKKDEDKVLDIRVTNLTDLSKEWKVGEPDREISLSIKSATSSLMSVDKLLSENRLTVTSSNSSVISVNKLTLKALKAGASTITVKADTEEVKFNLDVIEETKTEEAESKALSDVINTDATNTKYFKTEGVISAWSSGSDGGTYGNFYVSTDWTSDASNILVYGATAKSTDEVITKNNGKYTYKNPKDWNTNEVTKGLQIGDKISFYCMRKDHNSTKELEAWGVEFLEHKDFTKLDEPEKVAVSSLSEVLEAEVGAISNKIYTGKALISEVESSEYGNIKLTDLDGSNEVTSYGATASEGTISWEAVYGKYTYKNPKDWNTNESTKDIKVGDEVEFEMIRADYGSDKQVYTVIKSVTHATITETKITISGETSLNIGETITLNFKVTPEAQDPSTITWISSNTNVATIKNGVVTGIAAGKTSITAKYGNVISNELQITVIDSTTPDPDPIDPDPTPSEGEKAMTFEHVFKEGEINDTSSSFSVNGLTFNYSSATCYYFDNDYSRGLQIGSKAKPQTSGWTIESDFGEEVKISSYSISMGTAKGVSGSTGTVSYGDYSYTYSIDSSDTSVDDYSYSDKTYSADSFKLEMVAASKALYLKSIKISFLVDSSSSFNVTKDDGTSSDDSKKDDSGSDDDGKEDGGDAGKDDGGDSGKGDDSDAGGDSSSAIVPGKDGVLNTNYKLKSKEDYYMGIDFNDNTNLLTNLRSLVSTSITNINYGNARYALQYTDEDVNNKGYLYSLLDGDVLKHTRDSGKTWNREHVWPRSHMKLNNSGDISNSTKGNWADLHNLRASCSNANSSHGNTFYGEKGSGLFYPNITSGLSGSHKYTGDFRGDVARICFYMYVRYEGLTLSDNYNNQDNNMAILSTLIEWDKEDPVDAFEIQRNNRIYEYQGNRNPFIDYQGLISKII